jgi:hypothetical protein
MNVQIDYPSKQLVRSHDIGTSAFTYSLGLCGHPKHSRSNLSPFAALTSQTVRVVAARLHDK